MLADETLLSKTIQIILSETTTLGVRYNNVDRYLISREIVKVNTVYGKIRVKVGNHNDKKYFAPEYEDCANQAKRHKTPLRTIMRQQKKLLPRINMVKTLYFLSVVTVIFQSYPLIAQIDKFDMILHISSLDDTERIVFGDANGFTYILEGKNGQFEEVWLSEYLEGSICGLYAIDINDDDLIEIIVFTEKGRIYYVDEKDYRVIWSNPPGEYEHFNGHFITNIDDDMQPEIIICADGHLIIYDGRDQYEQWKSEQDNLAAKDILVADVDGDDNREIISDGYIFDAHFFDLEWQSPEPFGDRIGLLDLDGDGITELIGEFQGRNLRVFDVDLRREKSIAQ